MKSNNTNFVIILLIVLFVGLIWGNNQHFTDSYPDYTSFSTGDNGVGVLYDTLDNLQFPVGVLTRAVNVGSPNYDDVVFMIQPSTPRLSHEMAENILSWVDSGGRLIYLDNGSSPLLELIQQNQEQARLLSLRRYEIGRGEVVIGRADTITNKNIIENPAYGEVFANLLISWQPNTIYFAEYYHGFKEETGALKQMPLWLQLTAIQIIITAMAFIWHYGKRFGNPIPAYEEIEREENEQVLALARLLKKAKNRR